MLFISFCEAVSNEVVGSIDKWFVNKQVVVKLHNQLIVIQDYIYIYIYIYQLNLIVVYFKSEFSGKPDEDVEVHLLRTNDWMTTHDFPEAVKVQRFCLTLVGEARNWYATLEPVAMTWPELQTMFRHQYSKIGNMREQLFHAWRSFHYDENVETPDVYVIRIKQVARLLGYEDLQV